jgi:hypothetical protein
MVLIALGSFALNIYTVQHDIISAFYLPQTRCWELMLGAILAHRQLYPHAQITAGKRRLDEWLRKMIYTESAAPEGRTLSNVLAAAGVGLIGIGLCRITKADHFPGWWAVLPSLGAVLLIAAGAGAWFNRVILSNRVLVWFGLISFPLYLWHWPLLVFVRLIAADAISYKMELAAIGLAILLAWATYRLLERPVRCSPHGKAITIALMALMGVVGSIGYHCYVRDGLDFRFPKVLQAIVRYKVTDPNNMWRVGSCHLSPKQDYTVFELCPDAASPDKQTILLWGDSHAAHLYPGYKSFFSEKFNVIQRTASTCPPILQLNVAGSPYCQAINDAVFAYIKRTKPDKIVLAAAWSVYEWQKLADTITQLRALGINDITLVGPVPRWNGMLAKQLYLFYQNDPLRRIPERMNFGLDLSFLEFDGVLADFAKRLDLAYISLAKILCNADGCVTRTGETAETLTAFDIMHLTEAGSRLLVSQFPGR